MRAHVGDAGDGRSVSRTSKAVQPRGASQGRVTGARYHGARRCGTPARRARVGMGHRAGRRAPLLRALAADSPMAAGGVRAGEETPQTEDCLPSGRDKKY